MKMSDISSLSKEDLLAVLGLAPKASGFSLAMRGVGYFAAGLALGAGIGLLLAPKAGHELRGSLAEKLQMREKREPVGQGAAPI